MKTSNVPEIMNSEEIEILDENNMPIKICEDSNFRFNRNSFKVPFIIIDNFEKTKYKFVDIKRLEIPQLNKAGYRIISIDIKGASMRNLKNYPGQKKAYVLKKKTEAIGVGYELLKVPKEHELQIDVENNRIRLRGRNAYPYRRNENASPWIDL